MYKFTVLYYLVDDLNALEEFFSGTHLRLSEQLPGLRRTEISRVLGKPGGASRYHLMVESYFDDAAAFERALDSEPGHQLMPALKQWSDAKLITWFYADSFEE